MIEKFIGQQLIVDLYGCDARLLDDLDGLRAFIHSMCECIETDIVEESYHKFEPIGVSAYAVITTSHLSIHTWPEFGYAAVDVFSCDGRLTEDVCERMREALGAKEVSKQMIYRRVGRSPAARPPVRPADSRPEERKCYGYPFVCVNQPERIAAQPAVG